MSAGMPLPALDFFFHSGPWLGGYQSCSRSRCCLASGIRPDRIGRDTKKVQALEFFTSSSGSIRMFLPELDVVW